MKCPACENTLTEIKAGDILVDICKGGCGGIWFDEFEIKRFDEPHEFAGQIILNIEKKNDLSINHKGSRNCPKCDSSAYLIKRAYSIKEQVEVDQCSKCSGIWVDLGEIETIRSQYQSEQERQEAADKFLQPMQDEILKSFEEKIKTEQEQIAVYKEADTFIKRFSLMLKKLL